ncbi:uncharacterized protein LOC144180067 [Haemaphysalis longicornis]
MIPVIKDAECHNRPTVFATRGSEYQDDPVPERFVCPLFEELKHHFMVLSPLFLVRCAEWNVLVATLTEKLLATASIAVPTVEDILEPEATPECNNCAWGPWEGSSCDKPLSCSCSKRPGEQATRRKLQAQEAEKSKKFFAPFFGRPGTSTSPSSLEAAPSPATSLMPTQPHEGVVRKTSKQSGLNTGNTGDITIAEEDNDSDIVLREIEPDSTKPSELDCTKQLQPIVSELVQNHDLGLLKFDARTGKAVVSDAVRTEVVKLGAKYFQNGEGPFLPTNNRSMTKGWFKKKLGDGRGEEVTRWWLAYSPSKKSAFCICHLLFSRSDQLSSLEQEGGFSKWKAPERITLHENARNHQMCFTQWKKWKEI